jgi:hypothetical protein
MNNQEPPARHSQEQQSQLSQQLARLQSFGRSRWRWITAGGLGLLLLVLLFARQSSPPTVAHRISADTMSFPVTNQPKLIFTHAIGNVHIIRGDDGQVLIKELRNGFTDAIQIRYRQNGDTITTTSDIEDGLTSDTWVDFTVSVPAQAGFTVSLESGGTLEADGLNGQINLSNTNGSIWATNITGALSMQTESGSINAKQTSGQLDLSTGNGTITTSNVHASGRSIVQAESGTINFHGSLDPTGSYLFKNGNGATGLTLPGGAAFTIHAKTTSGSIASDFPGVTIQHKSEGNEARGNVGKRPLAQLTIQTTSGQINLFRGQ